MKLLFFSLFLFLFTSLPAQPADSLLSARLAEMRDIAADFRSQRTPEEEKRFVEQNTSAAYNERYFHEGTYPAGTQHDFKKAKAGDVIGPYVLKESVIIYKVLRKKTVADSMQVRHILIAWKDAERSDPRVTRTKDQARLLADSLAKVISSRKTKMEDLVELFTDDPGSRNGNYGNYGWITHNSGFIPEYEAFGFDHPRGYTGVMESMFGYHVMQVLEKSEEHRCVVAVSIEKFIEPVVGPFREYSSPEYPGGEQALKDYLLANLRYPEAERLAGIEGTILIGAYIDVSGRLISPVVLSDIPEHPAFSAEAIRLSLAMPLWQPCLSGDQALQCPVFFPVEFSLH